MKFLSVFILLVLSFFFHSCGKDFNILGDPSKLGDQDSPEVNLEGLPDINGEPQGASVGSSLSVKSFSNGSLVIEGTCNAGETVSISNPNITPNPTEFLCPASGQFEETLAFNAGVNSSQTLVMSVDGEQVETIQYSVDTTPPSLTVAAPVAGDNLNTNSTVDVTCAEVGTTITIENSSLNPNPTTYECTTVGAASIPLVWLPAANSTSQSISVTATDTSGNSSQPITVGPVGVYLSAPAAPTITTPMAGASVGNPTTVSGTCVLGATVTISNANITPNPTTTTCGSDGTFSVPVTWAATADGSSGTLSITQTDAGGNQTTATSVNVDIDFTAPAAPASATNSEWVASVSASPQFTWAPVTDAASYEVALGTTMGGTDVSTWTNIGSGASYTFSGLSLTECSPHYMSVRAVDAAGNVSPATVTDTAFQSDATPPSAPTITNVAFNMTETKSSTLTWTAGTDNCQVEGYETSVGTTSGGEEVVAAMAIPNSSTITSYQIEDGVDGFTIAVATETDYYTSLKTVDAAGNASLAGTNSFWAILKSCFELYTAGVTSDGLYTIDSDGDAGPNSPHTASCDMTTSPGGWTVVFNHNDIATNLFASKTDAREFNVGDPTNDMYSILTKVNEFKRSGEVELLLRWPVGPSCTNSYQHWKQTDGPLSVSHGPVPGYIDIDSQSNFQGRWTGLCLSSASQTLIDGHCTESSWWYAVGQVSAFRIGAPGCGAGNINTTAETQTQLLVR